MEVGFERLVGFIEVLNAEEDEQKFEEGSGGGQFESLKLAIEAL